MSEEADTKKKTSVFTAIQYGTTAAATLLFLRSANRFLTHAQRGRTISAAVGCLYLSVANEMGWFPFSFFVKERLAVPVRDDVQQIANKILRKDCFECRVIGTVSPAIIGTYILYATSTSEYYVKKPYLKVAVRSLAAIAFYTGAARWFYLPPFSALKGTLYSIELPDRQGKKTDVIYVMGVSGCGKSTAGEKLAERLGWKFVDGDHFHSKECLEKMENGTPLNDDDRFPWLRELNEQAKKQPKSIIACSSLKKRYREMLAKDVEALFVYLEVRKEELEKRMKMRKGHFMPVSMLDSQLATLEPPGPEEANVVTIDTTDLQSDELVDRVKKSLDSVLLL